jgi:hypothetical protein
MKLLFILALFLSLGAAAQPKELENVDTIIGGEIILKKGEKYALRTNEYISTAFKFQHGLKADPAYRTSDNFLIAEDHWKRKVNWRHSWDSLIGGLLLVAKTDCLILTETIVYKEPIVLDVRDFGATPNDNTDDDYPAIQKAIDSCLGMKNAVVALSGGMYRGNKIISVTWLAKKTINKFSDFRGGYIYIGRIIRVDGFSGYMVP